MEALGFGVKSGGREIIKRKEMSNFLDPMDFWIHELHG